MDKNEKPMCDKTHDRIDSVRDNSVDNMRTVDNIIGKSIRTSFEKKGHKYGFKIQFLYSSDLDGWYDDVSKTMYLSLSHAISNSIVECFNREVKANNLESAKVDEEANVNCSNTRVRSIVFFLVVICAVNIIALIYEWYDDILGCIYINGWASIITLCLIELFVYHDSKTITLKKEEETSEPVLGTMNMCGGIMDFESIDLNTGLGIYANYIAFLGIPIIFIGRFLAKEVATDSWREKRYKVYCQIDTPIREIYHFYIIRIGGIVTTLSVIAGVIALGSYIGLW